MADYVKVLNVAELDDPGKTILEVDDRIVVLVHVNGLVFFIALTMSALMTTDRCRMGN